MGYRACDDVVSRISSERRRTYPETRPVICNGTGIRRICAPRQHRSGLYFSIGSSADGASEAQNEITRSSREGPFNSL